MIYTCHVTWLNVYWIYVIDLWCRRKLCYYICLTHVFCDDISEWWWWWAKGSAYYNGIYLQTSLLRDDMDDKGYVFSILGWRKDTLIDRRAFPNSESLYFTTWVNSSQCQGGSYFILKYKTRPWLARKYAVTKASLGWFQADLKTWFKNMGFELHMFY